MRLIFIFISFFLIQNCSKPKNVLICGDHVCINKAEAEQYFEENLSIEVKLLDNKKNKEFDLVELNLKDNSENDRQVSIKEKKNTKEKIKNLSNDEIKKIKSKIKKKEKQKKLVKKIDKSKKNNKIFKKNEIKKINNNSTKKLTSKNNKPIISDLKKNSKTNVNKPRKEIVDVCAIIDKCSIDEISKFLLDQGKNKGFPDITVRE